MLKQIIEELKEKNVDEEHIIYINFENVVYNELVYRGYDVSVGNNNGKEIDFVATKYDKKVYYQVAYILADENIINRDFNADNINDNYPKYVLSMDKYDMSQNGIIHKNIIDWLLELD